MTDAQTITTTNPTNGTDLAEYPIHNESEVDAILDRSTAVQPQWAKRSFDERAEVLRAVGRELRRRRTELAELMADEMGKPIAQGEAEAAKCANACDYYADHAAEMLADVRRDSDLSSAWTVYRPLGTILAVMPWNFPLWQVIRFAAPPLMAGNVGLLKHASNVTAAQKIWPQTSRKTNCGKRGSHDSPTSRHHYRRYPDAAFPVRSSGRHRWQGSFAGADRPPLN